MSGGSSLRLPSAPMSFAGIVAISILPPVAVSPLGLPSVPRASSSRLPPSPVAAEAALGAPARMVVVGDVAHVLVQPELADLARGALVAPRPSMGAGPSPAGAARW